MDTAGLDSISGIGPARKKALMEAGIQTAGDLLNVLPRTYQDWSAAVPVSSLTSGSDALVRLRVVTQPSVSYPRRNLSVVRAWGEDKTGRCLLQWFNRHYVKNSLRRGQEYYFYGRVNAWHGMALVNPSYMETGKELPGLVPVYPKIGSVSPATLRGFVHQALKICGTPPETLPAGWPERLGLMGYAEAVQNVHFPKDMDALLKARERMTFDSLLLFQLAVEMLRIKRAQQKGRAMAFDMERVLQKSQQLPYPLTGAQKRVLMEVLGDMQKASPMARLVQGDVGSGKTVVALLCAYAAVCAGYQAALMAPTEILAFQHYRTALEFFKGSGVHVEFLSGALTASEKKQAAARIASGEAHVAVGTHALIQKGVSFRALGLAIADEQHRFGVMQRTALEEKGEMCDVLVMSATPIPRTLALILYADMDISVIDELPPDRKKTKTHLVLPDRRADMYAFIKKQALLGGQAYVICPLVEESEEIDALSAAQVFEELKNGPLKDVKVGLIHGRMPARKKEEMMEAFKDGSIQALVSTTVVEVGVDVPNATVMAVENAERFGLAQLHQLRGRVGRGGRESYCFLLPGSGTADVLARLNVLVESSDGFEVARRDLMLRGPGEFFGTRQHGALPWPGDGVCDMRMVRAAQAAAQAILALDKNDPLFQRMTGLCRARYQMFLEHALFH
ncbi:MAG: ATP-dependent DNA helicase RecG [Bacillota bacterium]